MTGNQIKKRLEELAITQEVAAKKLSVSLRTLQNWIAKDEVDEKIALLFNGVFANENLQSTGNGHNILGHGNKVINSETDKFIDLLKKKDEQIDRLLTLLENNQK